MVFHRGNLRIDLLFTMSDNRPPRDKPRSGNFLCMDERDSARLDRGCHEVGGARRNRTDDLLLAKQALSQLSYGPSLAHPSASAHAPA